MPFFQYCGFTSGRTRIFWVLDQDQGRAEGPDPTKHPDPASLEIRGLGLAENSAYLKSRICRIYRALTTEHQLYIYYTTYMSKKSKYVY